MIDFSRGSVNHKDKVYDKNLWVLICCDNLKVHLDADDRDIFYSNRLYLYCLSLSMIHVIEFIDIGLGMYVHLVIIRYLDK